MPKYLSGRVKLTPQAALTADRYQYLGLSQVEPNLGNPVAPGDSVPVGQQYQIVSLVDQPGKRYWVPIGGGLIPGSITVFDENSLVGGISSTTQLNFVGAAITASGINSPVPGIGVTIRVFAPGNNGEILFNTSNEFSTSSLLRYDTTVGLLTAGNSLNVGLGGTYFTVVGVGSVGIRTANPTQELDLNGNLRLRGTIYDFNNQPGNSGDVLVKNNLGGLVWTNQSAVRSGAGGTYRNVQFHNFSGLVDGAPNFVYNEVNQRVGIGSTIPKSTLDVLGVSTFVGGVSIDNLSVSGVTTTSTLTVLGITTTRGLIVSGITTLGILTGTSAWFTGIVTAAKFSGAIDITNLLVTGISTFKEKVNIEKDLGVSGLSTLSRLSVSGISTFDSQVNINNLNVTGVGTFDNIKLDTNTVSTSSGNLILDSSAGTTQINDALYVNDSTSSTSPTTGSIITLGGVGIGQSLNVAGISRLALNGGITTTGGDLYVAGNLYVNQDIFYDELFARNGYFTGLTSTRDLLATGITTLGITSISSLYVTGISTFDNYIDANGGAYIDNIQIGITNDNTIDTSTGNLTLDSAGGQTTINDNLSVTGITSLGITTVTGVATFTNNVTFGNATTDRVTFTSRVDSSIIPITTDTYDLGLSNSLRWKDVYAQRFNGQFVGTADNANQVSTGTTTGTSAYFLTFVDSNNDPRANESLYTDAEISYNPSTNLLSLSNLNVSGITTLNNLSVTGFSTFTGYIDANGGAYIDNIQIGITNDNTIDTSTGGLTLNSANGQTTIDDNLIVTGISTFDGNVILGDASTDTVTFNARVGSGITPSTDGTQNLGGQSNRWGIVYASTFNGQFQGTADIAKKLETPRNIDISGDVIGVGIGTTFDGTQNVTIPTELSTTGVVAGTYGSSTQVGIVTVDAKGRITAASNVNINFGTATVAQADKLTTPRNIDISGDVIGVGIGTTFDGTQNVTIPTELSTTGVVAGTYGSSTQVGILTVDSKGRVTAASNIGINFSTATVAQADKLTNQRNIEITGDLTWNVNFDGSTNVSAAGTLANSGVTAGTYGSSTQVGILTVDAKGRVTAASNVNIDFGNASVSKAGYADNAGIATNLKGGNTYQIAYQSSANTTAFISTTGAQQGQLLQYNTSSPPSWVNPSGLSVDRATYANYADNAGIATNLKGGLVGNIPYQSSPDSTTFLANGVSGTILQSNGVGAAPSWTAPSGLSVERASYATRAGLATDIELNGTNQLLYQASNNDTQLLPAGSPNQILQSNGSGSAPSWVNATGLSVDRANYADNAGIATNLKGGAAGSIPYQTSADTTTFLADPNANGRILTWNDTTNAPVWSDPASISIGVASSLSVTTDGSSTPRYLVLSNTTSGVTTALVDAGITYTPSTDLLTVPSIKPTSIQDASGGTGSPDNILTANGSGGWTWKSANAIGAISGITIQDESSPIGSGITTLNFIGAGVTVTSSAGIASITVSATAENVSIGVSQVGYNCSPPITSVGSTIVIAADSNAYGRRYIQATQPLNACDGDLWFDTSSSNFLTRMTAQSVSGLTAVDFTSIPSWVKRITVMFQSVSTNGTSPVIIQLGTTAGLVTSTTYTSYSGYAGGANGAGGNAITNSNGIRVDSNTTTSTIRTGHAVLTNITGNTWIASHSMGVDTGGGSFYMYVGGGSQTLPGVLDRLRITTSGGVNTFDPGTINVMYE